MYKYIISGMSLSKFLFVFFTFLMGFSLNSQAQILAEDPNSPPPAALALLADDLLWDQFDPTLTPAVASQRFTDIVNLVVQSADDFEVPAGKTWSIEHVNTRGCFFNRRNRDVVLCRNRHLSKALLFLVLLLEL